MTYDIFSYQAPKMPKPTNSTNFVKLVFSHTSQSMREPLLPMIFPAVSSFLRNVKFEYNDTNLYELCGQMGHLIGNSGVGKAQLLHLIEARRRPFSQKIESRGAIISRNSLHQNLRILVTTTPRLSDS